MSLSCPLARAGFSRFPASACPSAAPAQTIVWSSSIKRIICQFDFSTSLIIALRRSSKSPLYFAHAKSDPISRVITLFPIRFSGTSLSTILRAIHSMIAVFPTPGSQTRTGLFFLRLERICRVLRISSSRPMTGSIFHCFACSMRSIPYFLRVLSLFSGSLSVTFSHPLIVSITSFTFGELIPKAEKISCNSFGE
jgi:hypothetical protein